MAAYLDPPLVPRDGHTLRVIFAGRVSDPGPGKQDIRSLEDQEIKYRHWLSQHTDLPTEITVVAGSGKGEWLDRREYLELCDLVATECFDLVLTEDLGRIIRRIHAHLFCEECVDQQTRLISLNDHVDTACEGWEDASIFAAWHHERSNRDTSKRIKRTLQSRFRNGGSTQLPIYGYIKPPGAKSDLEWRKEPEAERIYKQWFQMLDDGRFYTEIADWLNEQGIKPGPYARQKNWDCKMVARVTHNWILKGLRFRNKRKTKRNARGKYVPEKAAPDELQLREVPHLKFFEADYYDRVVAKADERNKNYRRKLENGVDPRHRVPKKRTRFPGQLIFCGICGRMYVFGGHGQTDHLMCSGARMHKCWHGITVDGPLAAQKISGQLHELITTLPPFDADFLATVNNEADELDTARAETLQKLQQAEVILLRQRDHYVEFVGEGDCSPGVRDKLTRVEADLVKNRLEQKRLGEVPSDRIEIPTAEELRSLALESMLRHSIDSWEFNRLMHQLIPKIVVFPFRLCDGGPLVLRARFRFCPARLLSDQRAREVLSGPLERIVSVDLFNPPQREAYRERVVEGRKRKTERLVAEVLGITITAAQRAFALQRIMDELGIRDPYLPVEEPPDDLPKLRRHKHKRYRFEPLEEAGEI
jgi:site-specific DNA recombinase